MSKYQVHIPDCIIRNEDKININSKEFQLYYYLKILSDKQKSTNIQLNHNQYMGKFGIKSNSTFKKMFNNLYENNLIKTKIETLPKSETIKVQLNDDYVKLEPFTRININLYYQIDKVSHEGLRLMYYYESRINRTKCKELSDGDKTYDNWFSYAGFRLIEKETKINRNKIKEINDKLVKLKFIKVEKSVLAYSGDYDEFNQEIKTKYNNKYYPLLENVENYKVEKS